jgi:hypothetical protein
MRAHVLLLLVGLLFCACRQNIPEENYGPNSRADLVIILKPTLSQKDVNRFLEEELILGPADGTSRNRPGVGAIVLVTLQSYSGYSVRFLDSATEEERQKIIKSVTNSRFIFRVFENKAPNRIKLSGPDHLQPARPSP